VANGNMDLHSAIVSFFFKLFELVRFDKVKRLDLFGAGLK